MRVCNEKIDGKCFKSRQGNLKASDVKANDQLSVHKESFPSAPSPKPEMMEMTLFLVGI